MTPEITQKIDVSTLHMGIDLCLDTNNEIVLVDLESGKAFAPATSFGEDAAKISARDSKDLNVIGEIGSRTGELEGVDLRNPIATWVEGKLMYWGREDLDAWECIHPDVLGGEIVDYLYSFDLSDLEQGIVRATRYPNHGPVGGDWICKAVSNKDAARKARRAAYYLWAIPESRHPLDFVVHFGDSASLRTCTKR